LHFNLIILVNLGHLAAPGVSSILNFAGIVPLLCRWEPVALERQAGLFPKEFASEPRSLRNKN